MSVTTEDVKNDIKRYEKYYEQAEFDRDKRFWQAAIDWLKGNREKQVEEYMKRAHGLLVKVHKHKTIAEVAEQINVSEAILYNISCAEYSSEERCNEVSRKLKKHYSEIINQKTRQEN